MTLKSKIILGVFLLMLIEIVILTRLYKQSKSEVKRQKLNIESLTKQHNQELILTRAEFKQADNWWKHKIDSLMISNNIKLKQIKTVTILKTEFRDTGSVKIMYKESVKEAKGYKIPFSYQDSCWGIKGTILSSDLNSKIDISERISKNSAQLLVTRKRFLGFLWWKKKETFKAYIDCGEIDFTKIEFTK